MIICEGLPLLIFYALCYDTLFLILHVGGDQVIDAADLQLPLLVILGCVGGIVIVNLLLDLTDELNVVVFQIGIDRIRQTADQQVFPKVVHHLVVGRLIQRFQSLELLPHGRDGKLVQSVGIEKFLKVQREHPNFTDAAHGDRCGL